MIANEMSTLTVYDRLANQDARGAVASLGLTIAKSGMFGSLTEVQGELLGLECFTQQMPPMQLALRYHVIDNKLSMKADAMLAEFNDRGGKHKIISRTPDKAEVELTWEGNSYIFSFSWEEAKQEPFVYNGRQSDILKALASNGKLEVKAKYATPRSRSQMLWARATSDGVRAMCPGVNFGRYTPEELDESEFGESATPPKTTGRKPTKTIDVVVAEVKQVEQPSQASSQVVDVEFEPATPAVSDAHKQALASLEAYISASGDNRDEICKRFKVGAVIGLSLEQITTLLEEYRNSSLAGADELTTEANEEDALNAPCSTVQIDAFKQLIAALTPTYADIGQRIKQQLDKMVAAGTIQEARASRLSVQAMTVLLGDLKKGDANLTQFKLYVDTPF